jgi:hypothetical protein
MSDFFDLLWKPITDRLDRIGDLLEFLVKRQRAVRFIIKINEKETIEMAAPTQVKDNQKAKATVIPVDVDNFPTTLASPPMFDTSDPTLFTIAVDPNDSTGNTAILTPTGAKLGVAQIVVKGDPGGGLPQISGAADVEIVASAAAGFQIGVAPQ